MYFSDLMRGLLRRWYVLIVGFALAGYGAYYVYGHVPVRYEAGSTMMLLPPQESIDSFEGDNPYLILGGLGQALAVLTTRLNSQELHEQLASDGDVEYGVSGDTSSGAAFLTITTQTADEDDALRLLGDVQKAAEAQLAQMQEELKVTKVSTIGIMLVTADIEPTTLSSTRMQLTVGAGAAGAVLTVVLAAAIEGLAAARSRRKAAGLGAPSRERDPMEPMRASDVLHGAPEPPSRPRRKGRVRRSSPDAASADAGASSDTGDPGREADADTDAASDADTDVPRERETAPEPVPAAVHAP